MGKRREETPRRSTVLFGTAKSTTAYRPDPVLWPAVKAGLARGVKVADIAREIGVTPKTVYNWIHHPEAAAELREMWDAVRERALAELYLAAIPAARSLGRLSRTAGREDLARVKAATEVLDRVGVAKTAHVSLKVEGQLQTMTDEDLERLIAEHADGRAG